MEEETPISSVEFECAVQVGEGPGAYVQVMDSFTKNFLLLLRGAFNYALATCVNTDGTEADAGTRWTYSVYAAHSDYSS
jgi:hypothetical protein